jgi:hypothetical protein
MNSLHHPWRKNSPNFIVPSKKSKSDKVGVTIPIESVTPEEFTCIIHGVPALADHNLRRMSDV